MPCAQAKGFGDCSVEARGFTASQREARHSGLMGKASERLKRPLTLSGLLLSSIPFCLIRQTALKARGFELQIQAEALRREQKRCSARCGGSLVLSDATSPKSPGGRVLPGLLGAVLLHRLAAASGDLLGVSCEKKPKWLQPLSRLPHALCSPRGHQLLTQRKLRVFRASQAHYKPPKAPRFP